MGGASLIGVIMLLLLRDADNPIKLWIAENIVNPPLKNIRVLEIARILAGPWAGQVLADLGADVIKVEGVEGDDTRRWGPPFVRNGDGSEDAAYYHATNRGKRSITLDLKSAEGRDRVLSLVTDADVLIENFKLGGLAKFGLDYSTLKNSTPTYLLLNYRLRAGRAVCTPCWLRLHYSGHERHHGSYG